MRCKTENKRQEILDIAMQVFCERGFERTSMSEISSRLGGSKATLYNYFESKEELFFETMRQRVTAELNLAFWSLTLKNKKIDDALYAFGENFLMFIYSGEILTIRRLAIGGDPTMGLGKIVFKNGILKTYSIISEFLKEAMNQNKLRTADPLVATKHLLALLESETLLPFLMHAKTEISKEEIQAITKRAIDVFMKAYGF